MRTLLTPQKNFFRIYTVVINTESYQKLPKDAERYRKLVGPMRRLAVSVSCQWSGLWATVCNTVRPTLSDRCLSVLSVCNVGVLWPNGWMGQDETWHCITDCSCPPSQNITTFSLKNQLILERCNPWPHVPNRHLRKPSIVIVTSFTAELSAPTVTDVRTYGHLTALDV